MKSPRALTRDQEPNAASRFKEKRQPKIENRKSSRTVTTIRAARSDDIGNLIEMGREVFQKSGSEALTTFDERSFACALETFLTGATRGGLFVAELADRLVGMAAYVLFPFYFNVRFTVAQEMFRHCELDFESAHRTALLDDLETELEADARRRGADIFTPTVSPVRGYRFIEKNSVRRLSS